jgi:hypothetical protein
MRHRVYVLVCSDSSLWQKRFENRGSWPTKPAPLRLFCVEKKRICPSKSNSIAYQTGSQTNLGAKGWRQGFKGEGWFWAGF